MLSRRKLSSVMEGKTYHFFCLEASRLSLSVDFTLSNYCLINLFFKSLNVNLFLAPKFTPPHSRARSLARNFASSELKFSFWKFHRTVLWSCTWLFCGIYPQNLTQAVVNFIRTRNYVDFCKMIYRFQHFASNQSAIGYGTFRTSFIWWLAGAVNTAPVTWSQPQKSKRNELRFCSRLNLFAAIIRAASFNRALSAVLFLHTREIFRRC